MGSDLLSNYIRFVLWQVLIPGSAERTRGYGHLAGAVMADESPKKPPPPTEALGQILAWVVVSEMAVGVILATLALVKC